MEKPVRIASVNVNGIRAAYRKGMGEWLAESEIDILALQEVRAGDEHILELLGPTWHILHDPCNTKGRAGVAICSRTKPVAERIGLGTAADASKIQPSGRYVEADFTIANKTLTVASCYVHSGEVDTPKQEAKWAFLDALTSHLQQLRQNRELALIAGDLNVGHTELDIKNWRGNTKRAGFLPRERSYFDRFFTPAGQTVQTVDGTKTTGLGWVDVGRQQNGETPGPYTWWSNRGQAFDNDTGWRIDYHMATPPLAARAQNYRVAKAANYASRWSDHAPVICDYNLADN